MITQMGVYQNTEIPFHFNDGCPIRRGSFIQRVKKYVRLFTLSQNELRKCSFVILIGNRYFKAPEIISVVKDNYDMEFTTASIQMSSDVVIKETKFKDDKDYLVCDYKKIMVYKKYELFYLTCLISLREIGIINGTICE